MDEQLPPWTTRGSVPLLPAIQPLTQHLGSDLDGQCLGYFPSFPASLSHFLGSPKTYTIYTQGFVSVWTLALVQLGPELEKRSPSRSESPSGLAKAGWFWLMFCLRLWGQRRTNRDEEAAGGEAGDGEVSSGPVMRCWDAGWKAVRIHLILSIHLEFWELCYFPSSQVVR